MSFGTQDVERKVLSILKVLDNSHEAVGSRIISKRLKDLGIELGERAVRYHLKFMDERGLTRSVGRRDGRMITESGLEELENALVKDKVGLAISRIEELAFRTTFDLDRHIGSVPVNISFFPKEEAPEAFKIMKPVFSVGLCVSELVAVAHEGQMLGELVIPQGKVALATVCSIVMNGTLLKAGVPIDSKFGGLLQIRNHKPLRFVELVHYSGCSLDPSEIFIRAKMTSVAKVASSGNGTILANFREIPAACRHVVDESIAKLREAGLGGVMLIGNLSEPVCEIPMELNRMGMVLIGGLNPIAAVEEAGIEVENRANFTIMDYQCLVRFSEI